jgi:Rad3-related DNA helicase
VVDAAKVAAEVTAAELTRDRLQAALPRLRARYTEVREQEDIAAWKADAEEHVARRDTLAIGFYKLLPPELLKQVAERLHALRAFDREIDALNRRRPDDRSVRPLDYATPELARELKADIGGCRRVTQSVIRAFTRLQSFIGYSFEHEEFVADPQSKVWYCSPCLEVLTPNRRVTWQATSDDEDY